MLSSIELLSFKCFKHQNITLRPLTLLSGLNGGGKSSVMQAMVLLAQTMRLREWGRTLLLDTPDLALGTAADVVNENSADRTLGINVSANSESIEWTFKTLDRRAFGVELANVRYNSTDVSITGAVRWLLPESIASESKIAHSLRALSWISAERTGPRELLALCDPDSHVGVGARGELAAARLQWRRDEKIHPSLCIDAVPPTLLNQVRARMQKFFAGFDLAVKPVDGASVVSIGLRTNPKSVFRRPQNVGFGLTQLFPIIVALLAAKPDDVLLIENPEVHLHPCAQQAIGHLIAEVAASGVQILVETHSDHVVNGIRLAVKNQKIENADVAIHFFAPSAETGLATMSSPQLNSDGRLSFWPEGFFDQFDLALSLLM